MPVIIPGNILLKYISHLSYSLLRFAVPRFLVVKIHGFLIVHPTTLFLDIAHLSAIALERFIPVVILKS